MTRPDYVELRARREASAKHIRNKRRESESQCTTESDGVSADSVSSNTKRMRVRRSDPVTVMKDNEARRARYHDNKKLSSMFQLHFVTQDEAQEPAEAREPGQDQYDQIVQELKQATAEVEQRRLRGEVFIIKSKCLSIAKDLDGRRVINRNANSVYKRNYSVDIADVQDRLNAISAECNYW